jgi:hypothetical protein
MPLRGGKEIAMSQTQAREKGGDQGPPTIDVSVVAPKEFEARRFTFAKTMKVGDAAAEAAAAFGYQAVLPSFQNADGEVLDREKPLVAAGVRDGDELELVDVGGGV